MAAPISYKEMRNMRKLKRAVTEKQTTGSEPKSA